jgi:hypothetical protein
VALKHSFALVNIPVKRAVCEVKRNSFVFHILPVAEVLNYVNNTTIYTRAY